MLALAENYEKNVFSFNFQKSNFRPNDPKFESAQFFFSTKNFLGKSYKIFMDCHIYNFMESVASVASLSKFVIKAVSYHFFLLLFSHHFFKRLFHSHFNLPWHHAFSMCINILLCSLINQY